LPALYTHLFEFILTALMPHYPLFLVAFFAFLVADDAIWQSPSLKLSPIGDGASFSAVQAGWADYA
jgi:hypothetical protein